MADLKVSFSGNRKEAYCSEVNEGEHGLYLLDNYEEQIGWIPYEKIDYVRGKQTTED